MKNNIIVFDVIIFIFGIAIGYYLAINDISSIILLIVVIMSIISTEIILFIFEIIGTENE